MTNKKQTCKNIHWRSAWILTPGVSSKHRSGQGGKPKVDVSLIPPRCFPDRCLPDASLMLPRYRPDACQIPDAPQMPPTDASQMPPRSQMSPRCLPQMPPRCLPDDASQMFPICFPDPRCPPNASHEIQILPTWVGKLRKDIFLGSIWEPFGIAWS